MILQLDENSRKKSNKITTMAVGTKSLGGRKNTLGPLGVPVCVCLLVEENLPGQTNKQKKIEKLEIEWNRMDQLKK